MMLEPLFLQQAPPAASGGLVTASLTVLPAVLCGLLAPYFLLPRPRKFPPLYWAAFGLAALVALGFLLRPAAEFTSWDAVIEASLFYLFAVLAVVSGVLLITQSNP